MPMLEFFWKQFSVGRMTILLVTTHIQSTWLMHHLLVYLKSPLADELVIKQYGRPFLISRNRGIHAVVIVYIVYIFAHLHTTLADYPRPSHDR